jgi:hypothetical protein
MDWISQYIYIYMFMFTIVIIEAVVKCVWFFNTCVHMITKNDVTISFYRTICSVTWYRYDDSCYQIIKQQRIKELSGVKESLFYLYYLCSEATIHCCFIFIICAKMQLYIVVLSILFVFRGNYTLLFYLHYLC